MNAQDGAIARFLGRFWRASWRRLRRCYGWIGRVAYLVRTWFAPNNRWIVFAPVFNQEHFIRSWVANAVSYADQVLAMFSEVPWNYNPAARDSCKPDRTGEMLAKLEQEYPKLKVVRGIWESETDERNAAIKIARRLGARFLLIADCDEFYVPEEVAGAKRFIESHPADLWLTHHVQLVKQENWAIITPRGLPKVEFALDLSRVHKFQRLRRPEGKVEKLIPAEICKCYHYSYCMPYEKLVEKLSSFGHAQEVQRNWLKEVWPKIQPGIRSFHPVHPDEWAGIMEVKTPEAIKRLFEAKPGL